MAKPIKRQIDVPLKRIKEAEAKKNELLSLKTLDSDLSKINSEVADMLMNGGSPDLTQMSWKLYEQYVNGDLQSVIQDQSELKDYCDFKKKELVMRFIAFMDMASISILNRDKLDLASIKEISGAMTNIAGLINNFLGEASKIVKHDHVHQIKDIKDPEEINRRIQENQEKLRAIEVQFEEVPTTKEEGHTEEKEVLL